MSDQNPIFVIESNDFVAARLRESFVQCGFEVQVQVVAAAPGGADSAVITPTRPIRLGRILDQIAGILSAHGREDVLKIGNARLDVHHCSYYADEDADSVRLTEKETALLVLLAAAKGEAVSREALLENVWQYAIGVETHTLETHIYRLRQKIEEDPAEPKILQTNDAGYFLSVKDA